MNTMNTALVEHPYCAFHIPTLDDDEAALVTAICNRVGRMIGLSDREGLQRDFAILQAHYPIDIEALLKASDDVLVQELLRIVDNTDRATGTLHRGYRSRFRKDAPCCDLA